MGEAALVLIDEVAGDAAVDSTFELTLIQGGLSETGVAAAEAGGTVLASEVAVGGGVVVGGEAAVAGGATAVVGGAALATAGIALVIIGIGALGYYLYKRHDHEDAEAPALPKKKALITPCAQGPATGPSARAPVMPSNLTVRDQELWERCKTLHETYKQTNDTAALKSAEVGRKIAGFGRKESVATPQDKLDLCALLAEFIKDLKVQHRQRQSYVDNDCDRFDWFGNGETAESRKLSHEKELENLARRISNVYEMSKKFCQPAYIFK